MVFFARVRWVGRVLDGAGIATYSKTGRELSTALINFSKYCEEKNRRGDGASGVRLDVGPAGWALLGAIFAPDSPLADGLEEVLGLPHSEVEVLLTRVRESAVQLAQREFPNLLATLEAATSSEQGVQ